MLILYLINLLLLIQLIYCKTVYHIPGRGISIPVIHKNENLSSESKIIDKLKQMNIKCILSDIDGTFITDGHKVSDRCIESIEQLLRNHNIYFFPATGRTRKSMMDVTNNIFNHKVFKSSIDSIPGVYAQGLQVYGLQGELIYERFLPSDIIAKVESFCMDEKLALIAYGGEQIICKKQCAQTNKITAYCEPIPEEFPQGLQYLESLKKIKVNKVIILAEEEDLMRIRPKVTNFLGNTASVTKAVPGMLEILPYGASKGDGVKKLLEYYNVSLEDTIAFGDGENDIEMLDLVELGIAVDNAKPLLKDVANAITLSNNDDGVGHVLELVANVLQEKLQQSLQP